LRRRTFRRGRVKSEDGIEPSRELAERSIKVRLVRLEKGGIEPLRELYERSNKVRLVRLEKEGGIGPWNSQFENCKTLREAELQLRLGSWP